MSSNFEQIWHRALNDEDDRYEAHEKWETNKTLGIQTYTRTILDKQVGEIFKSCIAEVLRRT
jgi:hypothetical protein